MKKKNQYPGVKKDAVQKNIDDKKTTKMLDKLMFEKTTGLGSVTRTLSNMPEDANHFVTNFICLLPLIYSQMEIVRGEKKPQHSFAL